MLTPTLTITIGIPCSGKTTWSKQYLKDHPNCVRVSRDDFRYMLRNQGWLNVDLEQHITAILSFTVLRLLISGYDVIIDNTSCKLSYINEFIRQYNKHANIEFKLFDIELTEAKLREKMRFETNIPMDVIEKMYNDLQTMKRNFDFKPIIRS